MGKRDYRHRETKKPKKAGSKLASITVMPPPASVEVIKKGKPERKPEEEE